MIRTNENQSEVHGVLFQKDRRVQVDLTITKGARNTTKKMLVNGNKPKSRTDLADVLPITIFTPDGVGVVRESPETRRTFLTNVIEDKEPKNATVVERFNKILKQRNALLYALDGEQPSITQKNELDVWTTDFVDVSNKIIEERQKTIADLLPLVQHFYEELSQTKIPIGVSYEKSWNGDLENALSSALNDDLYRRHTTLGPHRDDIVLTIDSRDAKKQASQGEQRSIALALRLAGHNLVKQERGVEPLLLLDDVFSELDPQRSDRLLHLLPVGQTLVTTASPLPQGMNPAVVIDLTKIS
jgi:DNA replication and repair protein RecF